MNMKRIIITALVPEDSVDGLNSELSALIETKHSGKLGDIQVSDAPPQGSGATLSGVS